jgi:hypothetical protein
MEKVFRNKNRSWTLPLQGMKPTTSPVAQLLTWTVTGVKVDPTRLGQSRVEANTVVFPLLILSPCIMSWSRI